MSSTAAITARMHREGKKAQANATVSMSPVLSTTSWRKDPCRLRSGTRLRGTHPATVRPQLSNPLTIGDNRRVIDFLPAQGLQSPDGRVPGGPSAAGSAVESRSFCRRQRRQQNWGQTGDSSAALTELCRRSIYSKETVCLHNPDRVCQCCPSSGHPEVSKSAQYFGREWTNLTMAP
jgi:hypothetical protein